MTNSEFEMANLHHDHELKNNVGWVIFTHLFSRFAHAPHRLSAGFLIALASLAFVGCARPNAQPIFPQLTQAIEWPSHPQPARIRYVGSLTGEADLKKPRQPFAALGELLVGKKQTETLYGPRAIVVTRDGRRVWVADPGGRCLHFFDLIDRNYKRILRLGDGPLVTPVALCLGPDDTFFLADSEQAAIYHVSAIDGHLLNVLKIPDDLRRPASLAFDEKNGELWVVDVAAHDLKVLGVDGSLKRIVGQRGERGGEFNYPCDVAMSAQSVWIADAGNHRVQAIDFAGQPVTTFGQVGDASGDLALPKALAVDAEENVYVVDGRFENVQIFNRRGELLLFFGEEGHQPGQFWLPSDIFIEPSGRIWICDSYNKRVQVFDIIKPTIEVTNHEANKQN